MPRQTLTAPQSTPIASLALSDLHIRLQFLEKQHQSLLKKIKTKRTELNNFVEQIAFLKAEYTKRAIPLLQQISGLDQEIHLLFQEYLNDKDLSELTRIEIRVMYLQLQTARIISKELDNQKLDKLFENTDEPEDFSTQTASKRHRDEQAQPPVETPPIGTTESSKKIRSLFLKLASVFHPDKVTDPKTRSYNTEIMKQINKAYQSGDLARLLEIERLHQVGENIDENNQNDLMRKCSQYEQQNQILTNQYQNLLKQLNITKKTPEGIIVTAYRKNTKRGFDTLDFLVEEVNKELNCISKIRDIVKNILISENDD